MVQESACMVSSHAQELDGGFASYLLHLHVQAVDIETAQIILVEFFIIFLRLVL